jgi:hypothetical protein
VLQKGAWSRRLGRVSAAQLVMLLAAIVFVVLWGDVLIGRRTLIAGDILYGFFPWVKTVGAHAPRNGLLGDPVTLFLPMQTFARESILHGQLPLWNPHSLAGTPQFANDQSAFYSPFNLIALAFAPARGLSLAMLLKLVVAGVSMGLLVRRLGAGAFPAACAAVVYATSSYLVVWLGFSTGSVAAVAPLVYAAADWFIAEGRPLALAAVALSVALCLVAGHAETTFQVAFGVALFCLVRSAARPRQAPARLTLLAVGVLIGVAVSGVHLLPFVTQALHVGLASSRSASGMGFVHLPLEKLLTWVVPSLRGNPSIDGYLETPWNFNESTGFVGVGALVLAAVGGWTGLRRRSNPAIALLATLLLSLGMVYGALSPLAGRLPVLASTINTRFILTACIAVAALAGLGLGELTRPSDDRSRRRGMHVALLGVGGGGLLGVALLGLLLFAKRARVDSLLGHADGVIFFWVLLALTSGTAAIALVIASRASRLRTPALAGVALLLVMEGAIFAGPYNPHVPPAEVLPPSDTVSWLQQHAPTRISAYSNVLIPSTATVYGYDDVRSREVLVEPRYHDYWSAADPHYDDSYYYTFVLRPDVRFLAAAGVDYFVTTSDFTLPGTTLVHSAEGLNIARVDGTRPFAYFTDHVVPAAGEPQALAALRSDPTGAVTVEQAAPSGSPNGATNAIAVDIARRDAQALELDVTAPDAGQVVILQAYSTDWKAEVDGRTVAVAPANVLFQAVAVPPGRHRVSLRFEPASLKLGAVASLIGLALVGLLALADRAVLHLLPTRRLAWPR